VNLLPRETSRRTLGWEESLFLRSEAKKGGKGAPKSIYVEGWRGLGCELGVVVCWAGLCRPTSFMQHQALPSVINR
jgi:hypothetical protein